MKSLLYSSVFGILLIYSCHNNPLKTNEKKLSQEILEQYVPSDCVVTKTSIISEEDSTRYNTKPFKNNELRFVDTRRPPVEINLINSEVSNSGFKLSDFALSIKYIKLQVPPDSILTYDPFYNKTQLVSLIRSDDRQLILQGICGITRFSMEGEYLGTIWKNEKGVMIGPHGIGFKPQEFFGIMPNNPISVLNGCVYYLFTNGLNKSGQFMKYNTDKTSTITASNTTEVHNQGLPKGDTLLLTKTEPSERFDWIYGLNASTWVGINNKWIANKSGTLIVTFNSRGDTICKFKDYNRLLNYNKGIYRNPENFISYYFNGQLTLKQEYNDTIFRLIPPNRLLPVYIINFDKHNVTLSEGLNPDADLSEKYLLSSFNETNNYLFIRFTKNHDTPNNRKKNAVKFFNVVYDKTQKKIIYKSSSTISPEDIVNDLDGGIPFWPDFITEHGKLLKLVSGNFLKKFILSNQFKITIVSEEMRQKFISEVNSLRSTDMIIILVK